MNIIEAINITKKYGKEVIFENLTFGVKQGQCISIVGPSGRGKTTLLRCLIGLEYIEQGSIKIDGDFLVESGKYVDKKKQKDILRKIGIVFQNFNLFDNLTVYENLTIVNKDDKSEEKINKLLDRFGLLNKKNLYPSSLSGGQKQRVAIVRTIMLNPKIILFDEPTSALDSDNKTKVVDLINDLKKMDYTLVIVTHDLKLVSDLNCEIFEINDK